MDVVAKIFLETPLDRKFRASEQIYTLLKRAIISLELPPNQPISEQEVASTLTISRTPVREAFIRLSEEGLLNAYPQFGTFVAPIRMEALLEAQFLREAVECATARRAAEIIDPAKAVRLRAVMEKLRAALTAADWAAFHSLDEETHYEICVASGMPGLARTVEQARAHLDRVRYLILPDIATNHRVINQHGAIIEAICQGQPDAAYAAMQIHMRDIINHLPELKQRHPAFFEEKIQANRNRKPTRPA